MMSGGGGGEMIMQFIEPLLLIPDGREGLVQQLELLQQVAENVGSKLQTPLVLQPLVIITHCGTFAQTSLEVQVLPEVALITPQFLSQAPLPLHTFPDPELTMIPLLLEQEGLLASPRLHTFPLAEMTILP
jgi:hypothetical protein